MAERKAYRILVQRWVCYEETVEVHGRTEREARESALVKAKLDRGRITKNKTTVLEQGDVPAPPPPAPPQVVNHPALGTKRSCCSTLMYVEEHAVGCPIRA